MRVRTLARHGAALAVAGLLATLAAAAPIVNAKGGPPRSVFLRLPGDAPQPSVAMRLAPSADGRWLVTIETRHFTFTSLCLAEAEAVPVGHAHVIVNGEKVGSAYGPITEIGPLPPGKHDVTVVLRGQDHRALIGNHGLIKADATIEVPQV